MSKGNRIIGLRCEPDLVAEMEEAIARANEYRADEPYTLTSWIKATIRERLAHLKRGRRPRRRAVARPADELARACERGRQRAEATADKEGAKDGN